MVRRRLILVTLLLFVLVSCVAKSSNTPKPLRVSINSWVGFSPLFIARDTGIFSRHGINVDISKTENAPDRRAALIARRVDVVGSTVDDLAVSLSQGVDALAFSCADYSNGADAIIGAGDVKTLEQLSHLPVAAQPGFVNHFFLLYVLDSHHIPTDHLLIQPMTPDDAGAAFISGSVNAAVTWEPHISEALQRRPGTVVLATSRDYPGAILDIFIANADWYEQNREQARAFKESWDEAVRYMQARQNESMKIISREIGVTSPEAAGMLAGAKLLNQAECKNLLSAKADNLSESVQRLWAKAGYLRKPVELRKSLTPAMQ